MDHSGDPVTLTLPLQAVLDLLLRAPYAGSDGLEDPALRLFRREAAEFIDRREGVEGADALGAIAKDAVRDFVSFRPDWTDRLTEDGAILRAPDGRLHSPIPVEDWARYLHARNATRRFLVDTNNLYVDVQLGETSVIEPYQRAHRLIERLPLHRVQAADAEDRAAEAALAAHLGVGAEDDIPWSFAIKLGIDGLNEERRHVRDATDWGHAPHHAQKDGPPAHIREKLDQKPALAAEPVDLLAGGPPGLSRQMTPAAPRAKMTREELEARALAQLAAIDTEFLYYRKALLLARKRELNSDLRHVVMHAVTSDLRQSIFDEIRASGTPMVQQDRFGIITELTFESIDIDTKDEESVLETRFNYRRFEKTRPSHGEKQWVLGKVLEDETSVEAVLFIDWRLSRISAERSRRGKIARFWDSVFEFLRDELIGFVAELALLGALKIVAPPAADRGLMPAPVARQRFDLSALDPETLQLIRSEGLEKLYRRYGRKLSADPVTIREMRRLFDEIQSAGRSHIKSRAAVGELAAVEELFDHAAVQRITAVAQTSRSRTPDFLIDLRRSDGAVGTVRLDLEVTAATLAKRGQKHAERGVDITRAQRAARAASHDKWNELQPGMIVNAVERKLNSRQVQDGVIAIFVPGHGSAVRLSAAQSARISEKVAANSSVREVWLISVREGRRRIERLDTGSSNPVIAELRPRG